MKNITISIIVGVIGIAPFLLGAMTIGGSSFRFLAFPTVLLQHAVFNWGLELSDVELNRWALVAQFVGYFVVSLVVLTVVAQLTKKHNKSLKSGTPKSGAP